MAIPDWITLDKTSGTGGGEIKVDVSQNFTVDQKEGQLNITTASGLTESVSILQTGKPSVEADIRMNASIVNKTSQSIYSNFELTLIDAAGYSYNVVSHLGQNISINTTVPFVYSGTARLSPPAPITKFKITRLHGSDSEVTLTGFRHIDKGTQNLKVNTEYQLNGSITQPASLIDFGNGTITYIKA